MKTDRIISFRDALNRLQEAVNQPETDTTRDSAILRFQLCFDLAWKCIKDFAKSEGIECYSPKSCLRSAFQLGLIEDDPKWMEMVEDRNEVAHVYMEKLAKAIAAKLPIYVKLFNQLLEALEDRSKQPPLQPAL